jgi:hypothetical protein
MIIIIIISHFHVLQRKVPLHISKGLYVRISPNQNHNFLAKVTLSQERARSGLWFLFIGKP